ncbi:MAG: hypothetical protein KFF77_01225 [Bacteroidetes bacterium]|nr:hypothetical protein [Bacteroidota bacterium]
MKHAPLLLPLLLLLAACSSTPVKPVFSDFMEIREIRNDDPLAAKFADAEGEEFRLGDPVVSGKSVSRLQVKRVSDERFDLLVTLTGADDSRWRRFARSRGRQAALVVDGTIRSIFEVQDPGEAKENEMLVVAIPSVTDAQEDADRLDQFFEESKAAKRVKKEDKR